MPIISCRIIYSVLSCPFCLGSIQYHSYSRRLANQYDMRSMMLIISIEDPAGCKVSALLFDFWFKKVQIRSRVLSKSPLLTSITDPIFNVPILRTEYCIPLLFPTLSPLYRYSAPLHKSLMFTIALALQHQYHPHFRSQIVPPWFLHFDRNGQPQVTSDLTTENAVRS